VALDRLWAEAALRENEERYRLLFQEATEGIGLFDAKTGIIMDCNQALVELVGRKKSELVGQPQEILYSPKASPGQVSRTLELHRGEKAGQVLETQVVTRTGEIRDVEIKASLLDLRGKPVLQGIFRDITQQKQAEQALRRYNAELQTHNEELDAFAHTVAHDLKNPLGSLMGFADTLAAYHETMPDEEQSACMKAILRNGQRMSNIIDELLLLASVRKEDVTLVPLDMSELVAEARHRVDYIVKDRSIRFIVPLASAWPPAVGHAPWVEEVWVNYLSNAIKYGAPPPETHQSLHIELGAEVLPNGMVRFWVRDNGRGLTPDEQARLFAPFTQLQQVRAKGHGLGLSIVRRIVEKLGGQVAVESEGVPGKGSLFSFTLPAAVVSSDPKSLSER
jgi:PAS domain S-box-containing protein